MRYFWLALILVLASILRLFNLSQYPAGFNPDEAAFGYNAYSLLLTGRDEWGTSFWQLPLTNLRSFNDYKLPLYSFLAVPGIKLFGLHEFATRLPNALLGILAVAVIYALSTRLFSSHRVGLASGLLLAISPWHIQLSRGAFEANLITFFLPLGLALFLSRRQTLSAIAFALGFYSYHSGRYFTPLAVGLLFLLFPKLFTKKFLVVLALLILPGLFSLAGNGSRRPADVAIFHPTDSWSGVVNRRYEAVRLNLPDSFSRLFSNRPEYVVSLFFKNYLSYLSPQFLFLSGAGEAAYGMIPGIGVIYLTMLPLFIISLVSFIKHPSRSSVLIFGCLLLAPVIPALTKGVGFAANRAAVMSPFLIIVCALGWDKLTRVWPRFSSRFVSIVLVIISGISLSFFVENYLFHAPYIFSRSMSSGRAEVLRLVQPLFAAYPEIRISRSLSEPQIYVAFYLAVDPRVYQTAAQSWSAPSLNFSFLDLYDGYRLGKFRFGNLFPANHNTNSSLLIGQISEYPDNYPSLHIVNYLDGSPNIMLSHD